MLFWIVGGCVLVSAVFWSFSEPLDPWSGLNAAGTAGLLYLIALLSVTLRKPFSWKARAITLALSVILGAFVYSMWTGMEEQSRWQRSQLLKVGSNVARGTIASELHATYLLPVFERYHQQDPKKKQSIGTLFQQRFPNAKVGENLRPGAEDSTMVFLVELTNDRVTLIGQAAHFPGRNLLFENHSGRIGMVQARATLTEKGILYEEQN